MATLKDVATYAKVSVATVSRSIAKPLLVSPKTRQRIDAAINATGYCHTIAARRLKPQSRIIMVILPCLQDPYFVSIVDYLNVRVKQMGYYLVIVDIGRPYHLKQDLSNFSLIKKVDGVILLGSEATSFISDTTPDKLPPIVIASESRSNYQYPTVCIDNLSASFHAVDYLIQLGHTNIGQIMGIKELWINQQRQQGYQQALRRAGIPLNNTYTISRIPSLKAGAEACARLLQLPTAPTALFCHNDLLALGALKEAQRRQVQVPRQLSIIGFNGIEATAFSHPALTTIRQPYEQIIDEALNFLLTQINGRSIIDPSMLLKTSLIERDSVCSVLL